MKKKVQKYNLKAPCSSDSLEIIRKFVIDISNKIGISSDSINKIELAVDEACSNVVKHAYDSSSNRSIMVEVKTDHEKMTIKIKDTGKGFDPDNVEELDMKKYLSEYRTGGLGIHLMRTLMDVVSYNIKPGVSNQVVMTKYLSKSL